jgi:Holliday junction resolvase
MDRRMARSQAQEKRGAKLHGGTRNAGSGNHWQRKNDVRARDNELIEYKRTDKQSITIKGEDTEGVWRNALLEGRSPLFGFELLGRDWICMPAGDYERLKSDAAGLHSGQVLEPPTAGPDVPTDGTVGSEATQDGQGTVHRRPLRQPLPDQGFLS